MSQQLINLNDDLTRLSDEGFELEILSGFLLVRNVPYVNGEAKICFGALVSELTFEGGDRTARPRTHVAHFIGEAPCDRQGNQLAKILNRSQTESLAPGLTVNHMFSSKPKGGYADYYEKLTTYFSLVSSHAYSLDPSLQLPEPVIRLDAGNESVFHYTDSASTRAGIVMANQKLALKSIAIVGLGGTGAYVLDLVAKSPVKEIHLYDGDDFEQHTSFRAPGATSIEDLRQRLTKVEFYSQKYSKMRSGIVPHPSFIDHSNVAELTSVDSVFVCVDRGSARRLILESLQDTHVPAIDVGMGLYLENDSVGGLLRVSTSTPAMRQHLCSTAPMTDMDLDAAYSTNIQTNDLNALNAALAVVKWKKLYGFYHDFDCEHSTTFTIDGNTIMNSEKNHESQSEFSSQLRRSNPR